MFGSHRAIATVVTSDRHLTAGINLEKAVSAVLFSLTAILIIAPVGYVIYGSIQTGSPLAPDSTFTWANLAYVYGSKQYRSALYNTVALSLVVAVLSVGIGSVLA